MNTPTYNAQFLTIDYRMLDHPEFGKFMMTRAFAVYLQLRRYIWRSRTKRHPLAQVNDLLAQGNLVATADRSYLAQKLGVKDESHISRYIGELCKMGIIERISTGRQNIYILGKWEDRSIQRDGSYIIELFLLDRYFGMENRPQIIPGEGNTAMALQEDFSGMSTSDMAINATSGMAALATPDMAMSSTSGVSKKDTSGVPEKPPYKYRKKKIEKQQQIASLLREFPFSQSQLEEIASSYSVERIGEVLKEYRQRSEEKIKNPAGWVLAALKAEYHFDSAAKRVQAKHDRLRAEEAAREDHEAATARAQEQLAAAVQDWIEAHPEEYAAIFAEERQRWQGSTAGESPRYLHACARVRVQSQLAAPSEPPPLSSALWRDRSPRPRSRETAPPVNRAFSPPWGEL